MTNNMEKLRKLLFIGTLEPGAGDQSKSPLWEAAKSFEEGKSTFPTKYKFIGDDAMEAVVIFPEDSHNVSNTQKMIEEINGLDIYRGKWDLYIASHAFADIPFSEFEGHKRIGKKTIVKIAKFSHAYHPVYNAIKQLVIDPNHDNFDIAIRAIVEAGDPDLAGCLALIRHKIVNLMAAPNNDFSTLLDKGSEKRPDHLSSMKETYGSFKDSILKLLHCVIADLCEGIEREKVDVKPSRAVHNGILADWSVKGIVSKLELDNEEVSKLKNRVGLDVNWRPDEDSDFIKFIRALDTAMEDGDADAMVKTIESFPNFRQWTMELYGILKALEDQARSAIIEQKSLHVCRISARCCQ